MVNAAQRGLFGAVAAEPLTRRTLAPLGVRKSKRGRGATAPIELVLPVGGAGRKLRFRFRPLQRHCAPVSGDGRPTWRVACELLVEYAAAVGGFRLARHCVVRAWADLLADFTPQEVRWAVRAKAASIQADTPAERRSLRRFVSRPEHFPAVMPAWLALSPEHQRWRRAADAPAAERLRQRLAEVRPQRLQAVGGVQADTPDADVRRPGPAGVDRSAQWRQLSDTRRAAAVTATRRLFLDRCEAWGLDPHGEAAAAVRLGFAADWAYRQWPPGGAVGGSGGGLAGAWNGVQGRFVEVSRTV